MIQVTIMVDLGPRQSFPSALVNPSVPWDSPNSVMRLPNNAHTKKTHWCE